MSTVIGIIALPQLAEFLTSHGYTVLSGDSPRAACQAIENYRKTSGHNPPLVLVDQRYSGLTPWIEKYVNQNPQQVVAVSVNSGTTIGGNLNDLTRVNTPTTVHTLLTQIGVTPTGADYLVDSDGFLTPTQPQTPQQSDTPPQQQPYDPTFVATPPTPPTVPPVPQQPQELQQTPQPTHHPATVQDSIPPLPDWLEELQAQNAPTLPPTTNHSNPTTPPLPVTPQPPATTVTPQTQPISPDWLNPQAQTTHTLEDLDPTPPVDETPQEDTYQQFKELNQPNQPILTPHSQTTTITHHQTPATTIISFAAKGGVGKTSLAMTLAQRAATLTGKRVALIDGNRGQGDTRAYLKLSTAPLPTIYDLAAGTPPQDVVIKPNQLAANRPNSEPINFAVVFAPPPGLADPTFVTTNTYQRLLDHLHQTADIIIIDTQILEDSDTSGLWDDLWVPALQQHAYGIGAADLSPGVKNLLERLRDFTNTHQIPPNRLYTLLNRVPTEITYNETGTQERFQQHSTYLGRITNDHKINEEMNLGNLPWQNPQLQQITDSALHKITGNPVFLTQTTTNPSDEKKRSLLNRVLGRG